MPQLLLIDDDRELVELLTEYLTGEGFQVRSETDGERGLRAALEGRPDLPDLIVLDVMLPGLNGFDLLRRLRAQSSVPVLMLSGRGEEVDRVVGLEIGADDYLPKPFSPRELAARIRAVLRRGRAGSGPDAPVAVGDLVLDPAARTVLRGGASVDLTGVEFSLLERLMREAGRVVTRESLYRDVLGRRPSGFDRSLDVHLSALRRKLGPGPQGDDRFRTVRGVGYQLLVDAHRGEGGETP